MRRGFWLVTGAVLGVSGYRRATRLARTLTGQAGDGSALHARHHQLPSAIQLRWRSPLALSLRSPAGAAGPALPVARIASAAGFVKDVQDGMAEYRDLHRGAIDRTLGSQDQRTVHRTTPHRTSTAPEQGHREP